VSTRPVNDPNGDQRALLLARLEHNTMTWTDRVNIEWTEDEQ